MSDTLSMVRACFYEVVGFSGVPTATDLSNSLAAHHVNRCRMDVPLSTRLFVL